MFDPEKVERLYVREWGHHAVYASDYDKLLALYREISSGRKYESDSIPTAEALNAVHPS